MIISKYGKTYDTADGSEPSSGRPLRRAAQDEGKAPDQRWEDDGGPLKIEAGDAAAVARATEGPPPLGQFVTKPTWSVRSLRDLNEAVRLEQWPENPAHAVRPASEAEQCRLQAIDVAAERAASATYAQLHRRRQPVGTHLAHAAAASRAEALPLTANIRCAGTAPRSGSARARSGP